METLNLFNIIKNEKEYWLVDQIKRDDISNAAYLKQLTGLLDEWRDQKVGYLSLLMDETNKLWLLNKGFNQISSIVEYTRKLDGLPSIGDNITWHALSEGMMRDQEYSELYQLCTTGSANKNEVQPIAKIMHTLKSELGLDWRKHCFYFKKNDKLLGIGIPHIEMGTEDEGRLFYFGVVPDQRGKGIGTKIHKITLSLLKGFSASYYVGSTDVNNEHMIKIFEGNGCYCRDRKGIYKVFSAQTTNDI